MPIYGAATGDRRVYADRASFDVTNMTVSLWVKYIVVATGIRVIARSSLGTSGAWGMGQSSGGKHVFAGTTSSGIAVSLSATGATAGVWYHYLGTWTGGVGSAFFLNGNADGTAANVNSLGSLADAIILCEETASAAHANSVLAGLGIWNVALSQDDISALATGIPPHVVRPDALIVADMLDADSVDIIGFVRGTTEGQLVSVLPAGLPLRPLPWDGRVLDDEEDENFVAVTAASAVRRTLFGRSGARSIIGGR